MKNNDEYGFTLIELLVIILIIGILAAIAIPAFLNQRQRANDSAVQSDVRNVAMQIESALVGDPNASIPGVSSTSSAAGKSTIVVAVGNQTTGTINLTNGVSISVGSVTDANVVSSATAGSANSYGIRGHHSNGKAYVAATPLVYNSAKGGLTN